MSDTVERESPIKDLALAELFSTHDLVIPEIQREYVWGADHNAERVLIPFCEDMLKHVQTFSENRKQAEEESRSLQDKISEVVRSSEYPGCDEQLRALSDKLVWATKSNESPIDSRVGFLYAYIPGYVRGCPNHETLAYLIDGQQRITTVFLIWLYLARKAGGAALDEFRRCVRFDAKKGTKAFDFRVRLLTHEFVHVLVANVMTPVKDEDGISRESDFSAIEDSIWFLAEYRHDVSIMSMVNALKMWDGKWRKSGLDAAAAFEYLARHVRFWMFVINETAQGEQLYITMNGRGCNLSDAEIIRAKVFRDAGKDHSTEVGRLFENLNTFFWKNRIDGEPEADNGVRKFFRWVYLLERYDRVGANSVDFSDALQNDKDHVFLISEKLFGAGKITFARLKKTFEALEKLRQEICEHVQADSPSLIRPSVFKDKDDAKTFQRDCFVLLPLLAWVVKRNEDKGDLSELSRLARYLRKLSSKSDVKRAPAKAIPEALKLAKEFANYGKGGLLDYLDEYGKSLSTLVCPEEEPKRARRLLAIRDDSLRSKFEKLLLNVEDFKMVGDAGDYDEDYRLAAFLDLDETWRQDACAWDEDAYKRYETRFYNLKNFESRSALRRMQWLMMPDHAGYFVKNENKLRPLSRDGVMDNPKLMQEIIDFEARVHACGEAQAFDEVEREFLKRSWNGRNADPDVKNLAAIALSAHRIVGGKFNDWWLNLQFDTRYYEKDKCPEDAQEIRLGKYYFWFVDKSRDRWIYAFAVPERLLKIHDKNFDVQAVEKFIGEDVTV